MLKKNYLDRKQHKVKTSHYGVENSKDYNRAQQQNPNIKNQLNMFGRPSLSPKHVSQNGTITKIDISKFKTVESYSIDDEERLLQEWNLNNSLEGKVNFVS